MVNGQRAFFSNATTYSPWCCSIAPQIIILCVVLRPSSSVVVEFQMMDRRDWNKSRLNKIRMKHQSIMSYRLSDGQTLRTDYGQTTSEVWKQTYYF